MRLIVPGRHSATLLLASVLTLIVPDAGAESLTPLLGRALARDPQVRVAQSLLEISDARVRQLRSRLWPTLGLNANVGQSSDLDFGLPVERRTERSELALRWNLYNGGNDGAEFTDRYAGQLGRNHEVFFAGHGKARRQRLHGACPRGRYGTQGNNHARIERLE